MKISKFHILIWITLQQVQKDWVLEILIRGVEDWYWLWIVSKVMQRWVERLKTVVMIEVVNFQLDVNSTEHQIAVLWHLESWIQLFINIRKIEFEFTIDLIKSF